MRPRSFLFFALGFLAATLSFAQTIGSWNIYPSYYTATQNVSAGNMVYSLSEGNLLAYNTEDTEVRTFSRITGLNGAHIAHMAYNNESRRLLLVYEDANIDLLDGDGNIQNLSALRDKTLVGKDVTAICMNGRMAYLSTGFGLVEIDTEEGFFGRTCQLGLNVKSLAISDKDIFLATDSVIYSCPLAGNIGQRSAWHEADKVRLREPWQEIIWCDGTLYGRRTWNIFKLNQQSATTSSICGGHHTFLRQAGKYLVWGNETQINFYDPASGSTNTISMENQWQDVSGLKDVLWVSEGERGLRGYRLDGTTLTQVAGPIQPNSPKHDLSYRISWVGDRLLVAGGINTVEALLYPATTMYFENGTWTNFQEMDEPAEYPDFILCNISHVVQDPDDPNHHFASLYRRGLCEYRDGKFVKFFNCDNSPLRSILPESPAYYRYVSCAGLQYDGDGNLWMLNSETDTIVRIRLASGRWAALYYPEIAKSSLCDDYLFHSSGLVFLNCRRTDIKGFFCLDTKGSLLNTRDDRHRLRTGIVNQDGTTYAPNEYYCLTEDFDGRIWCGTDIGLFVINDASEFMSDDFQYEQVKIPRDDGSGLADYLLNGVSVSCIAVDGANRKWIGTNGSGLYLVSADGTQMIHHFMASDSPLLSDNIMSLAVHPASGLVMIATENGLCSYLSDATEGAAELDADNITAFPNPVSPDYTGPIVVRGLPADSEVKILSASGQLIWSGTSAGGTFTWNGCTRQGRRVSSGVYHVVASDAAGHKAVATRIVVIR